MKSRSGFIQKIAVGVICVIVFAYTVYHITGIFGEDISTFAAGITTESTVLSYNGYVFRDEQVLTSENTGLVDYKVTDGSKVGKGQALATVYESGRMRQRDISELDRQIRILRESLSAASGESADIVSVKEENRDTYGAIVKLLASGETGGLSYQAEKLLTGMNCAAEISSDGKGSGISQTLEALLELREEVFFKVGDGQSCVSPKNGYFFSGSDGCETYFTSDALEDLTLDKFDELVDITENAQSSKGAYGRITDNSRWSMVLPIPVKDKKHFVSGSTYEALFSENNQTAMPLYLERIIEEEGRDTVLLVFSCDRQPENFVFNRCQSVSITISTVSGIYVPKSAVKRVDGARGVYILRGSIVYFRYIETIYEGSDYYLVSSLAEHTEERTYLRPNDMIILNGNNMFDGRVLD